MSKDKYPSIFSPQMETIAFTSLQIFHVTCAVLKIGGYLRIGSCLACVYRVMDARGKFGDHERSARVALGCASSNSSFLSALQTSQVQP